MTIDPTGEEPQPRVALLGRREFLARYRQRMDELFTGSTFDRVVVGKAAAVFRNKEWLELGVPGDLNDAPWIADVDKAHSEVDRVAAEAWSAWMRTLGRDPPRELIIGPYNPAEVPERYSAPVGAVCAPEWWGIREAHRAILPTGFASWTVFTESQDWALYCDCENFAILGASAEFIDAFRSQFGEIGRLRTSFKGFAEDQLPAAWDQHACLIPDLIRWPPG